MIGKKLLTLSKDIQFLFEEIYKGEEEVNLSKDDLVTLKDKIIAKVNSTTKHCKIAADINYSKDKFVIQGKSIDTKEKAKEIGKSIILLNATNSDAETMESEVIKLPSRSGKNLFKITCKSTANGNIVITEEEKERKISYAQALMLNIKDYNAKNENKVFINHEIPRGLKNQNKIMDEFAYKIRKSEPIGKNIAKFQTKIVIDKTIMIPIVKVKAITKGRGKNVSPQWNRVEDIQQVSASLKTEYKKLVEQVIKMEYSIKKTEIE